MTRALQFSFTARPHPVEDETAPRTFVWQITMPGTVGTLYRDKRSAARRNFGKWAIDAAIIPKHTKAAFGYVPFVIQIENAGHDPFF